MRWPARRDKASGLTDQIATALSAKLKEVDGPVVVINKLEIQVNYCAGGGATLNVKN